MLFFCLCNENSSGFQFHFWVHAKTKTFIYLFSDPVFRFCQGVKTCHVLVELRTPSNDQLIIIIWVAHYWCNDSSITGWVL
jgi:hypothetical protein